MTETQTKTKTNSIKAAVQPVRDLNDEIAVLGRKAGTAFLDLYQAGVNALADYQDRVADTRRLEWVAPIAHAHTKVTREATNIYVTTTRDLLA